jgi:hypothetical protein
LLDALRAATAKALDLLRASCPTALLSTPTGRVEAMHQRLGAMLQAVCTVYTDLEDDFLLLLYDVARQMRTVTDQMAREHGTTRAQFIILAPLEHQQAIDAGRSAGPARHQALPH